MVRTKLALKMHYMENMRQYATKYIPNNITIPACFWY